jgi:hypothetical protein
MLLLPTPTSILRHPGSFDLPESPHVLLPDPCDPRVRSALHETFPHLHHVAHLQPAPHLRLCDAPGAPESYSLRIACDGIQIDAPDPAGHFYALQTLRQLLRLHPAEPLPCLQIDDAPSWPLRGYYLDVSRGRVPRPDSLKRRIRLLAALKINQLHLYFEHPFRFQFDPSIAGDGDAFSPDDLRDIDHYCRQHFIELVPSFTCFGHMGRILSLPAYRSLAEVEFPAPSWEDATWLQRMRGATLHSRNPESQDLLRRILDEFLPCFSSARFNLCGDETHDLGKRDPNASPAEVARQYLDHVLFVRDLAARHGKSIQLWGDMLLQHPAAIPDVPPNCEILDWAYYPANRFEKCNAFISRGLRTFVCPSVRGFGRLFNAVEEARTVLAAYARIGHEYGAGGLLNTDWGDYGHFNMPPCSFHGLALGAQLAWNPSNDSAAAFDLAFSRFFFDSPTDRPARLFALAGSVPDAVAAWPFAPLNEFPPTPADPGVAQSLSDQAPLWADEFDALPCTEWADETDRAQLALACRFLRFGALLAAGAPRAQTLPLLDSLEKAYAPLWFAESQPRGLLDLHARSFAPMRQLLLS